MKVVSRAFNRNEVLLVMVQLNGKFADSSLGFSRFSLSQSLRTHNENYSEAGKSKKC